jgi:predicted amidophosphoribosyltransferase
MESEERVLLADPRRELPDIALLRNRLRLGIAHTYRVALDLLFPPRCLICRQANDRPGELCADCWRAIRYIDEPMCAACGFPFEYDLGPGAMRAACHTHPPQYSRRAVMAYDDNSRGLLLALKYGDKMEGVPTFARWMARAGRDILTDTHIIVPVPLHRWRLLSRRYNQSAVLANRLAELTGRRAIPDLMVRVRATPSQGGLNRSQRRKNVRGAFAVRPGRQPDVEGRNVLLVDDF